MVHRKQLRINEEANMDLKFGRPKQNTQRRRKNNISLATKEYIPQSKLKGYARQFNRPALSNRGFLKRNSDEYNDDRFERAERSIPNYTSKLKDADYQMIDDITSKLNKEEIEEILKDYKRKLEEDKEENEETTQQRKNIYQSQYEKYFKIVDEEEESEAILLNDCYEFKEEETNILNTVIKGDDFVSVKHDNVNVEAIAEEKEEVKGEVKDRNDIIHEGGSDEEYEEQKINKGYTKDVKVENNKVFVKLNGVKLTNTITCSQQCNGHTNVRSKSIGDNYYQNYVIHCKCEDGLCSKVKPLCKDKCCCEIKRIYGIQKAPYQSKHKDKSCKLNKKKHNKLHRQHSYDILNKKETNHENIPIENNAPIPHNIFLNMNLTIDREQILTVEKPIEIKRKDTPKTKTITMKDETVQVSIEKKQEVVIVEKKQQKLTEFVNSSTQANLYKPEMINREIQAKLKTNLRDEMIQTDKTVDPIPQPQIIIKEIGSNQKGYYNTKDEDLHFDYLKFGSVIRLVEYYFQSGQRLQIHIESYYTNRFKFAYVDSNQNENSLCFKVIPSTVHFNMFDKLTQKKELSYGTFCSESADNFEHYKNDIGKKIKYDEPFQLFDEQSNSFLTYCKVNMNSNVYELTLEKQPSKNSQFLIESAFIANDMTERWIKTTDVVHIATFGRMKPLYLCKEIIQKQNKEGKLTDKQIYKPVFSLTSAIKCRFKIDVMNDS